MIIYLIFFLFVLVINYLDYKAYKTIINPVFFLSVPFSCILFLCIAFNPALSFVQVYPPSIIIWIAGYIFLLDTGKVICPLNKKRNFFSK